MKKLFLSFILVFACFLGAGFSYGFSHVEFSALFDLPFAQADNDDDNETNPVDRPEIPLPDFLPGPDIGEDGGDTQNYILNESIPRALNIFLAMLGIAAFVGILIGAIQMLTAYGNEEKVNRGKTNLRYALLGFALAIFAYAIVSVIVSISLPNEYDADERTWIPKTYAVDVEEDLDILFPNQREIIQEQEEQNRVALPGGDFLGETVPAIITNIIYLTGFLIFIAITYAGVLLVIARGNEEAITKAKNILTYSGVALAMISLGYALIYGIANLNVNQDEDNESDDVFVNTQEDNE